MRKVLVLLGVALAGAAFAAEEGAISIEDLIRARPAPSPRAAQPVQSSPARHDGVARRIAGEEQLLASSLPGESLAWLDPQSICSAVDAMLGPEAPAVGYDERTHAVTFEPQHRARVEKAIAELRSRAPGPVAVRVTLDRAGGGRRGAEREVLLHAEGHADPARTLVLADAVERMVTSDFDVELAQASSIGDPVLTQLRTGVSVALCVTPMPDGRTAVVESVSRSSSLLEDKPIELGHEGFGRVDRCSVAFDELGACFRVENGRPGEIAWTGRDGSLLRLRVEASWTAPPPAGEPAMVVSPIFRSEFAGFRHLPGLLPHDEANEGWSNLERRSTQFEELAAMAFEDKVYAVTVKGGGGVAVLPAGETRTAPQQLERLVAVADRVLLLKDVRIAAVNAPTGAAVKFGEDLPEGAFVVASYEGPVVRGLPATATGGTEMRYLVDWDVEVAQSARIPDPLMASVATGHFLNFTVRDDAVDLDLDLSRLERLDRQEMRLAVGRVAQGVQDTSSSSAYLDPALPPETVAVEKPVVATTRVVATVPLDAAGRGVVRRSGGALAGRERELVLLIEAR